MADLLPEQIEQIRDIANTSGKIDAIKLFRKWTKSSLSDSKQYVEALLKNGPGFVPEMPDSANEDVASRDHALSDEQMDQILDALNGGTKLEAIKLYRKFTGLTLMDSKVVIENLMKELGIESTSRAGCGAAVLLFVAVGFATAIGLA